MAKRNLRVVKWVGTVPAVGVCTFCDSVFAVPLTALKRVADAQESLRVQFTEHKCKKEDASQATARIVKEATHGKYSLRPDQTGLDSNCTTTGVSWLRPSLTMPPKRGNPNWGRGQPFHPAPSSATEFDMQVRRLGLTKQTCADSTELRRWCESNRNRCYVPEWLLGEWGIAVNPTFGW